MGESCRLRILATWCSNKLSSGVQPQRGSRPFLRVGERERRAWKDGVGKREEERETARAEEETTEEEERWERQDCKKKRGVLES